MVDPVCVLKNIQTGEISFSVYVPDIGYNPMVAYAGPPVTVASGKVRGDDLIIGFKLQTSNELFDLPQP